MNKAYCSVVYVDEEGDLVIKHAYLTAEEQLLTKEEGKKRGLDIKVYDLTVYPDGV